MVIEGLGLLLQLPPLAFGPNLPPNPFQPPRALVCDVHELGYLREVEPPCWIRVEGMTLDPRLLRPAQERFLVNRAVDSILFLGVAYAGRASWADDRSVFNKTWSATPFLAPYPALPPGPTPPVTSP
jgi:hypothetical protein